MGKQKRRLKHVLNGVCPCGSDKAARQCCFTGKHWKKPPGQLHLRELPATSAHERCYMKELNSCEGPISGEHLISESVIKILAGDGEFSVSGLPWLKPGEEKILATGNLRTNCLCSRHNSALSPIDESAKYFFQNLKIFLETDTGKPRHALVSGHDIERWLLKTAKAFAVSRNFAKNQNWLATGGRCISSSK